MNNKIIAIPILLIIMIISSTYTSANAINSKNKSIENSIDNDSIVTLNGEIGSGPDLDAWSDYPLIWHDVYPGVVIEAEFYIENIGEPSSELNWEIEDPAGWVSCFPPQSVIPLMPGYTITIDVMVFVPEKFGVQRSGNITVINTDNPEDKVIIPVEITTTRSRDRSVYFRFLEDFPILEKVLVKSGRI